MKIGIVAGMLLEKVDDNGVHSLDFERTIPDNPVDTVKDISGLV